MWPAPSSVTSSRCLRAARAIASYIPSSLPQIRSAVTRNSAGTWDRSVHFGRYVGQIRPLRLEVGHEADGGDEDDQLGDLGRGPAVGGEQHDPCPPCIPRRPHLDLTRRSNTARSAADTVTVLMRLAMALPSRRPQSRSLITSATDH